MQIEKQIENWTLCSLRYHFPVPWKTNFRNPKWPNHHAILHEEVQIPICWICHFGSDPFNFVIGSVVRDELGPGFWLPRFLACSCSEYPQKDNITGLDRRPIENCEKVTDCLTTKGYSCLGKRDCALIRGLSAWWRAYCRAKKEVLLIVQLGSIARLKFSQYTVREEPYHSKITFKRSWLGFHHNSLFPAHQSQTKYFSQTFHQIYLWPHQLQKRIDKNSNSRSATNPFY